MDDVKTVLTHLSFYSFKLDKLMFQLSRVIAYKRKKKYKYNKKKKQRMSRAYVATMEAQLKSAQKESEQLRNAFKKSDEYTTRLEGEVRQLRAQVVRMGGTPDECPVKMEPRTRKTSKEIFPTLVEVLILISVNKCSTYSTKCIN